MADDIEKTSQVRAPLRTKISTVRLPKFATLLAEVIAQNSISSPEKVWDNSNLDVITRLAGWFKKLGFSVEVQEVPNAPGKYNMLACLGEGSAGLVLSGHSDTVPFDQARWASDPFHVRERDHRFYGLGSCDMKGFFPIIVEALRGLEGAELRQPIIVLATADEESSMAGARALVKQGNVQARAALIGEPTNLTPVNMHKGIMMQKVRVKGQAGHSSNPALGKSALEGLYYFIAEVLTYRSQLQARHHNSMFEVSEPTLNLGHVHGGDSPNRICGHCEMSFDLRPLPGMSIESLEQELHGLAKKVKVEQGIEVVIENLVEPVPAFQSEAHSELVTLCEQLAGQSAKTVAFATEAPFMQQMGMDTVIMGAGSIDQAHQPNEFLELNQIKPMAKVIQQLIERYCIVKSV